MNIDDLVSILDEIAELLTVNRNVVTPGSLDQAENVLAQVAQHTDLAKLFNIDPTHVTGIIASVQKVIDIEKKVMGNQSDQKLLGVIQRLKNRPLILKAIAAVL